MEKNTNGSNIEKINFLNELAAKMAANAANISLNDVITSKNEEVLKEIFKEDALKNKIDLFKSQRFIVVLGAGSSYNACKGLKLGADAAECIKEKFHDVDRFINIELSKLKKVYKLNSDEFETILLALSKFDSSKLVDEIFEMYDHRYNPNLTYEILAHLFKNRFIDVIINFNFDEVLDKSIDDEMMNKEYYKVISDGDVKNDNNDLFIEGSLKKPIYIKPHGTVSHKSSMKFTDEDYYGLPKDIEHLLEILLTGKTEIVIKSNDEGRSDLKPKIENYKTKNDIPVNLIIIGFNMQSFEFNSVISDNVKKENLNIYFINKNPPKIDKSINNEFLSESKIIKITESKTLDNTFEDLWSFIENKFNQMYKPRGIDRHELISLLFNNKESLKNNEEIERYLSDRMYIELVLSIAKYKGFMSIAQLANDRFGKYYRLFKKYDNISLIKLSKKFELKDAGYSSKALTLKEIFYNNNPESKDNLTFKGNIFDGNYYDCLENILLGEKGVLSNELKNKFNEKGVKEKFKKTLKALTDSEDSEICPRYDNVYNNMFLEPKLIYSEIAINFYTRYYIKKRDWNTLFIVAESGEWLIDKLDSEDEKFFKKNNIVLIVADEVYRKELKNKYRDINIFKLNWWEHNQHMTIFANVQKDSFKILQSIYLERRLRYSQINPIIIKNEKDNKILMESFSAYRIKSNKQYDPIGKEDVTNVTNDLLNKIRENGKIKFD